MTATKKFGDVLYSYHGTHPTRPRAEAKAREIREDGLQARVQETKSGFVVWYYGGPIYKTFGGKKYSLYGGFYSKDEAEAKVASLRKTLHSKDIIMLPSANVFFVYYEKSLVQALDRSIYRRIKREKR